MKEAYRLLLVEDEPTLGSVLKEVLEKNGYQVYWESDGAAALQAYRDFRPQIGVIDIMLPGRDGFSIVEAIRAEDKSLPLIFLTARTGVEDVVRGFRTGASDYLRKPFMIEELIVRIEALLQRASGGEEQPAGLYVLGRYTFDAVRQELSDGDTKIQLSGREADLLELFAHHRNQLITKPSILVEVWGHDSFFNSRNLDVYVSKLRKYLSGDPSLSIINIRGSGYKFIVP